MSGYVPALLVREVRQRAGDICEYCLLPQDSQEATFHVDHVLPRALGGPTGLENLALACVSCSLRKAARVSARDPVDGREAPLFHPREHAWTTHFILTRDFRLEGRTATGRATIDALCMNRPAIIAIRRELNLLGRFPPRKGDS